MSSEMSDVERQDRRVRCPKCDHVQVVSVVATLLPGTEELQELMAGTLNRFDCSHCKTPFALGDPLVFRDDSRHTLIYLRPLEDNETREDVARQMLELTQSVFAADKTDEIVPDCRLTFTRRTFIEKICLHLAQLEDRIVEYIKYQLYRNPDQDIDPIRSELLYDFSNQDPEVLGFIIFDRETGRASAGAHIPRDVYSELAASFFIPGSNTRQELEELLPGPYVSVEKIL